MDSFHEYTLREFLKPADLEVEAQIKDGHSFPHALTVCLERVFYSLSGSVMAAPTLTETQDAILWGLSAFSGCLAHAHWVYRMECGSR